MNETKCEDCIENTKRKDAKFKVSFSNKNGESFIIFLCKTCTQTLFKNLNWSVVESIHIFRIK